jgi:hypothetical protein
MLTTFVTSSSEERTRSTIALYFVRHVTTRPMREGTTGTGKLLAAGKTFHTSMANDADTHDYAELSYESVIKNRFRLAGLNRFSQLMEETEHFCRWRQNKLRRLSTVGSTFPS